MSLISKVQITDASGAAAGVAANPMVVNTAGIAYTGYESKGFTITGAQTDYDVKVNQSLFATAKTSVTIKTDIACSVRFGVIGNSQITLAAGESLTIDKMSMANCFITTTGTTVIRFIAF